MMSAQIGLEAGPGGPAGLRAEGTDLPEQGGLEEPGKEPIEIPVLVKSSDLGFVK